MKKYIFISLVLFISGNMLLISCDFSKRLDTRAAVKEMKERELKRITITQLTTIVDELGKKVTGELNENLVRSLEDRKLIDSLSKKYNIQIFVGSPLKLKTASNGQKVNEILEAYQYNSENHIEQVDNVQKNEDGTLFYYTAPILAENQFKGLPKEKIEKLGELSKLDSLYFRRKNELIGLWMIRFERKEVIKRIDPKTLNK